MTIFITAALPRRRSTERLIDALNMNAGIIGFSLLITAILQTIQKRLDLFHAIFVTFVTYYLALIVYFSGALPRVSSTLVYSRDAYAGVFRWTLRHIRLGAVVQIMTVVVYLSWSIYVTASVTTFGSTPQCNSRVKYVFFFLDHSISATTPWWRKFWIISLCVGATCVIVGIVAAIFVIRWATRKGVRVGDLLLETYSPRASKVLSIILFWCVPCRLTQYPLVPPSLPLTVSQDCWLSNSNARVICACMPFGLTIPLTESRPSRSPRISTSFSLVRQSGPLDKCYHL
jgi:hypothetical protein